MFEKTSGSYNLIYTITLPSGRNRIIDCLSASQLEDLNTYLKNNGKNERHVIDGYVTSDDDLFISHSLTGDEEQVDALAYYALPIYDFQKYVFIRRANGGQTATLRMILTHI